MSARAGVDTGGTFTDLVLLDEETGEIRMSKVLSTPTQPSRAVFDSFAKAGLDTREISSFVHGTTVATNALIERRGAAVALLTTDGFRDILRIQRVTRPNHFDLHWVKPKHVVPRSRCVGIPERVLRDGDSVSFGGVALTFRSEVDWPDGLVAEWEGPTNHLFEAPDITVRSSGTLTGQLHEAIERNVIAAMAKIEKLPTVVGKVTRIRLEELL